MWRLFKKLSSGIAIDLGTANTLIYQQGRGIVYREPSVVARRRKTKEILAVGREAKKMIGKTPEAIEAFYPLRNGVIADFDAAQAMLSYYLGKLNGEGFWSRLSQKIVVIGTPSGSTEVERRALSEAVLEAGAQRCYLIEEPMAAAIGAQLPVEQAKGILICDIGGGTTEIAVISLSGIVLNRSLKMAGHKMDEMIVKFLRLKYSLLVGQLTAEKIKIDVGTALPQEKEKQIVIRGQNLEKGLPITIKINSAEIREAIAPVLNKILSALEEVIEESPPELVGDFLEEGIILCGGGAYLPGIDQLFSQRIKMPATIVDDPQAAVVLGCHHLLENIQLRKEVQITTIF